MTPFALYVLSRRVALVLFGALSVWAGIWYTLVFDRLPQNARRRRHNHWSRRDRLQILEQLAGR
jgi:hypothetical protein